MKNIIFDWSGVVKDTVTSQLWIVNKIFAKYGVNRITLEEFRENWEQPISLFYKKYLPKDYNEAERAEIYRETVFDKDCPKPSAFIETVELIKKCKNSGHFLAVVSSDLKETLYSEIIKYGLENIFNKVVADADDKLKAVQTIIKENNLNPKETFFVGDSNHEIDVAQKTEIKSIATTWGFTSEQKLRAHNPDYVVNNVQGLESIIS